MLMERERYPKNWNLIAFAIKQASQWHCENCGKPCRKPEEAIADFENPLTPEWLSELVEVCTDEAPEEIRRYKPQRFALSVAHLDQNPRNNQPENLKALCMPCHLRYDRRYQGFNRMNKLERQGQLNLFVAPVGNVRP